MTQPTLREEFDERGFVRIAGAFPAEAAAQMVDVLWSALEARFGVLRTDPSTWKFPLGLKLQGLKRLSVFEAIGSPATIEALDELLGEGRWKKPREWGSFLVSFPKEDAGPWTVPSSWHTDWPYASPPGGWVGALVLSFLSPVPAGYGGTVAVEGSPRLIARFIDGRASVEKVKMKVTRKALMRSDPWLEALASQTDDSDRVQRFMHTGSTIGEIPVRVVELTGEPGDLVIGHPWLLHSGAPNSGDQPRFMRVARIRGR